MEFSPITAFNALRPCELVRFSNWPCWLIQGSRPYWVEILVEHGARPHAPHPAHELILRYHLALVYNAHSFLRGLLLCLYRRQDCWLALTRKLLLSGSVQHATHRLIGCVIALGDLTQ